jgi:hypothetical protein
MSFLRHVGKHGDRKVAVVFREVPNEEHMCLVVYTQLLNQNIHDPMMSCIEGDIGQNSDELANALNRQFTRAGEPILQVLHREGMLKKVRTEEVVMTPQPNTQIRLDELNKILRDMKLGEEATKRLAEADSSLGLQDPADVRRRKEGLLGEKERPMPTAGTNDVLSNEGLAQNLMAQAQKMEAEAKGLMAESQRLLDEAKALLPKPAKVTKPRATAKKKPTAVKA